jgi:hypothetical protein
MATTHMIKLVARARNLARFLSICFLVLAALTAAAPSAGATGNQRPQECNGTLEGGVVNGDLVVPANTGCRLIGTTVRGDVRVGPEAAFDTESARITGNLSIGELSYGEFRDTRVGGNVEIRGSYATLDMFNGAIGGRVLVQDAERINLLGTTVDGNVRFERSRLFIAHGARIKGQIQVADVEFAAVVESRVGGSVTIERAGDEARICTSRIAGQATLQGNTGEVTVGGGNPALRCGGSTFDGNLRLLANTGGGNIVGNTVRGNLTCRDNNPAPVGSDNQVRGQAQGQCAARP